MITRAFGYVYTNGIARAWYMRSDGIRRWVDNDQPLEANA